MKIKGKYKRSETEFCNCTVLIENGLIHSITVSDTKPIEYFGINPKENVEIEYYKLPSKKGLSPSESNYKLQYKNKNGETNTVYVNISKWKLFCLKWMQKNYWIQKTDNWIRFLIPIVTGVIVFIVTKKIFGC